MRDTRNHPADRCTGPLRAAVLRLLFAAGLAAAAPNVAAHETAGPSAAPAPGPDRPGTPASAAALELPFLPAARAGERFAISSLTKNYDEHLMVFASQSSSRSPRTLDWLDRQAQVAAAAAAATARDSSDVRVATGGDTTATTIPPAEKKALEPPKPPVSVGIPSPVAIVGSVAGGLVLLVKLLTAMAR